MICAARGQVLPYLAIYSTPVKVKGEGKHLAGGLQENPFPVVERLNCITIIINFKQSITTVIILKIFRIRLM